MSTHTPTQPTFYVRHPGDTYSIAQPQPFSTAGACNCGSSRADAHAFDCPAAAHAAAEAEAHIVRCGNAHDALIAALRRIESEDGNGEGYFAAIARDALAQVAA